MSKVIYKYDLVHTIEMPKGAQILSIQMQGNQPTLWALVDLSAPMEDRHFATVGTGWTVGEGFWYITTYMDGPFVWHVFEAIQ